MDKEIAKCALESQRNHNDKKIKYNMYSNYSNNCTDTGVGVLACAGIRIHNPAFTAQPNTWFSQLMNNPPKKCRITPRGVRCR